MLDVKLEISNLIDPLLDSLKYLTNEGKDLLEVGLSEYLESQTEKYYLVNTFLHRFEKVRFFDIYHPLVVWNGKRAIDFNNLVRDFDSNKYITILGRAGSGKSTIMKSIFLRSIKTRYKIPVLFELRYMNEGNISLDEYIEKKLALHKIKNSNEALEKALRNGDFIFLFDGYDEVYLNLQDKVLRELDDFVDRYSKNTFVLTSRYGSGIESFPRFDNFKVNQLSTKDIVIFIKKMVDDKEKIRQILKEISILNAKNEKLQTYKGFLSNPLLLSMFILTYEHHPEIPNRKNIFYRNVLDTLYTKHDGLTKTSYKRERKARLSRDHFEQVLEAFCFVTYFRKELIFTESILVERLKFVRKKLDLKFDIQDLIYDFKTTVNILILDGLAYTFPHRSMQEYLCVLFISKRQPTQKKAIYEKYTKLVVLDLTDSGQNYWELSHELDKVDFSKHFILDSLERFLKEINVKSNKQKVSNFAELFSLNIYSDGEFESYPFAFRIIKTEIIDSNGNTKDTVLDEYFASDGYTWAKFIDLTKDIKLSHNIHKIKVSRSIYNVKFSVPESNFYFNLCDYLGISINDILRGLNDSVIDDDVDFRKKIGFEMGLRYETWQKSKKLRNELDEKALGLADNKSFLKYIDHISQVLIQNKDGIQGSIESNIKSIDEIIDF
ncbi:NACHT domain-containing protein [Lewinella cohaerens]|uniref:NACHT domain-containing protein n=1 Tax=Lewinella cohaerens TaxID=70995 RepID=UPI00037D6D67|nr:NACHT domain-containing protein [Lewinella cohaerens]